MAYLHPCKNCKFEKTDCKRRDAVRNGIAGLSITSVKFKCGERAPLYTLGQRIAFPWRVFEENENAYGDFDEGVLTFHGTVLFELPPNRYVVRVDSGPCVAAPEDWDGMDAKDVFTRSSDSLIIKVKTRDITALAEPVKAVCEECGAYDDEPRCHGHGNPGHWDSYGPGKCRKARIKAGTVKA